MKTLIHATVSVAMLLVATQFAKGAGDIQNIVPLQFGTFGGINYVEYEARFRGSTPKGAYDLPCLIVAPVNAQDGNGAVLLELLNTFSVGAPGGGEIAFGRFQLTDQLLFGSGFSYATVRWDKRALGGNWPPMDLTHAPGPPTTGDRYDGPETDAFDIVKDFANELRATGIGNRVYSYGYSNSATIQRGLLFSSIGAGLFDFSLIGARGSQLARNNGNKFQFRFDPSPPPATAGKVIAFQTETETTDTGTYDLDLFRAWDVRAETANYRTYEMAGVAHGSRDVAAMFEIPDAATANPFMGNEVVRALFIRGHLWTTEGLQPPASAWLGPRGDSAIDRDANGNATISPARLAQLPPGVRGPIRLPDVEVGRGFYLGVDPLYLELLVDCNPATCDPLTVFLYFSRAVSGHFVDLEFVPLPDGSPRFQSHGDYVSRVAAHAMTLVQQGYLLPEDAQAIVDQAAMSDVGKGP